MINDAVRRWNRTLVDDACKITNMMDLSIKNDKNYVDDKISTKKYSSKIMPSTGTWNKSARQ